MLSTNIPMFFISVKNVPINEALVMGITVYS